MNLPKEKQYLLKYFPFYRNGDERQKYFLFYLYEFGSYKRFTEHTGYTCNLRWRASLKKKYITLVEAHDKAKKEMDLDTLAQIETGKYNKFKLR
jgi:hypothetical protein